MKCNFRNERTMVDKLFPTCDINHQQCAEEDCILQRISGQLGEIQMLMYTAGFHVPDKFKPAKDSPHTLGDDTPAPETKSPEPAIVEGLLNQTEVAEALGVSIPAISKSMKNYDIVPDEMVGKRGRYSWDTINELYANREYARIHRYDTVMPRRTTPPHPLEEKEPTPAASEEKPPKTRHIQRPGASLMDRDRILGHLKAWENLPRTTGLISKALEIPESIVKQVCKELVKGPDSVEEREKGHYVYLGGR